MDLNKSQVWIQRTASGVAECSLRMISLIHSLYILVYYHRYIGTLRYEYILVNGHGKGAGTPFASLVSEAKCNRKDLKRYSAFLIWQQSKRVNLLTIHIFYIIRCLIDNN